MTPDDPRHGQNRGYTAGCREACCREAHTRHMHQWRSRRRPCFVEATGTVRRLQALLALGHSSLEIAAAVGRGEAWPQSVLRATTVSSTTAGAMERVYEELCMTVPQGPLAARLRTLYRQRGYLPPLAWDDIDNDPQPNLGGEDDLVDEVVVHRILNGDWRLPCTSAEKAEVCRRWFARAPLQFERGTGYEELERRTGWQISRYYSVHDNEKGRAA